jgi:hypothetical protein
LRLDGGERRLDRVALGDVEIDGDGLRADLLRERTRPVTVAIGERDPRARRGRAARSPGRCSRRRW